jgi:hypothetical protein
MEKNMGAPRPEDLVIPSSPKRPQKNGKKDDDEPKNIPPKAIMFGGGIAVLVLCVMMMVPSGKPPANKALQKATETAKTATPESLQEQQAPQALPPAAEIIRINGEIAKVEETLNAIRQQTASIDAEAHNLSLAAERLAQVGDKEGSKESERQIAVLASKRKELGSVYEKWATYYKQLADSRDAIPVK